MKKQLKRRKPLTILSFIMMLSMLIGIMPLSAFAYYEESFFDGDSLDVCTEGKTYSLYTEDNLEEQNGTTFLYVVKSGERYYTLGNPRYTEFKEVDYVPAIDITEYYDAQTNTFSGISNNVNVGAMQYQMNSGSYMYVDGDMLFALSVPFESEGNTWFEGGIRYYSPDQTYSYSRPSWHSNGDGSGYFYDSYIDWFGDSDTWVYGVLDLKYIGTNYVFALRDKSAEYNEVRNADLDNYSVGVNVKAYLYAAPCGHEQNVHGNADAPTCMEKGCHEYWFCLLCDTYFSNEEMTVAYEGFPEIDALGHDWKGEKCNNCNRPVPVYSKVTNKTDFFALADDTMYVLVAEYEGKYYTPDSSVLYSYVFDTDGDGYADIYNVDENNNGTPDIVEIDYDENGVFDLWDCPTEEERLEYFDAICHGYLTDMLYGQTVGIPVKEITLNPDGTISHDAAKDALEFEMIKLHIREDNLDYTFECVMQFVVPNTFINSPAFIPEDRPYNKPFPDEGDTYYWAVLFYNDRDSYYTYDWEHDEYVASLPFLDICKEDSIALSKSNSMFSPEWGEQMGCLRLRDYNGKLSFVVGNDYDLEGSEWIDDESHEDGGYYDTNDTQACVYLYASAQYDSHTCDFGDWIADENADTHTRTCKDPECGKKETLEHNWNDGVETQAPACGVNGVMTYTCPTCNATKTENIDALEHNWGAWTSIDETAHIKTCSICSSEQSGNHEWNDGVITKEPTEWEAGIKTFTCTVCSHTKTESIDKLVHECTWTDWYPDGDENHKRDCMDDNCDKFETLPHEWDNGIVTKEPTEQEEGVRTYTCTVCSHTKTESIAQLEHIHNYDSWTPVDATTHSQSCSCGDTQTAAHELQSEVINWETCEYAGQSREWCDICGYESYTTRPALGHTWDNGIVTAMPTTEAPGTKTYTCSVCQATQTEELPKCITEIENNTVDVVVNIPNNSAAYIPEGTVIDVVDVPTNEVPQQVLGEIELASKGSAKPLACYDLALLLEGAEIQPNGTIQITLPPLQQEFDADNVMVVYIAPDGSYQECKTTVNEDGTITFETDHFSRYAVIEIQNRTPAIVWILISTISVALIAGAVVAVIFIKKKKGIA